MSDVALNLSAREETGKGAARQLRAKGMTPGIIYGVGGEVMVSVSAKDLKKLLTNREKARSVITVAIGDSERKVLLKELTIHPLSDKLLHLDLWEVDLGKKIKAKVELRFTGVAVGVKDQGGSLLVARNNVKLKCLPEDLPPYLEAPVTDMNAGDVLSMKDLPVDDRYEIQDDPELTVVAVSAPKEEKKEEDSEGGALAVPE